MSVQKPTGRKKNEMIHHKSEVRDSPCPVLYAMWKKNGFARCDAVIDCKYQGLPGYCKPKKYFGRIQSAFSRHE